MKNSINKHKNYSLLTIVFLLFFCSCVSKKQVFYLQDLNAIDVSQISSSQHQFQENDILKIDITSLEPKASIPYNKILEKSDQFGSRCFYDMSKIFDDNETELFAEAEHLLPTGNEIIAESFYQKILACDK